MRTSFFLFVSLASAICQGQCDSDFDFASSNSWSHPAIGESFLPSCIESDYYDVWHILIPATAAGFDSTYPPTLPVDSVIVLQDAIDADGLYSGVVFTDTATNEVFHATDIGLEVLLNNNGDSPNGNTFLGGMQYCAAIQGVPNASGVYRVSLDVDIWATIFTPFNAPFTFEFYLDIAATPPTSLSLAGASQALCFGDSAFVEIIPSPDDEFSSYQWASDWNGGGGQVLDTLGAGAWLTAGSYQVTAVSDGVGCGGIETFVLSESTPPPSTYSDVNICWGDVEEVSFEFDGGSASPSEGFVQLQLFSSINGWDGSFLSIDVIHEDGTVTNSIVTMPNGSTFANVNNVPELAIVYGDSVEVTYVSNNPDNDQYFGFDMFNCVDNCISEPDNCYSFNDLTAGLLFSGPAGCGESIQGVWSEPSNLGNNVFSETSQFNTTWSAYQPGNYELCFEDFQCGVANCFNVSITEPEAGFDCDGNSLCGTPSVSTLTVEVTENVLDDLDLYKLYVDLPPNSNWYVSAVAGDQNAVCWGENPLRVTSVFSASEGVFNTTLNTSWNASGLSTAFLGVFPELAFDSYATIGLSGPASETAVANAFDPSFSGDEQTTSDFLSFFNSSGAQNFEMQDGAWYIIPTSANQAMADDNGRCLIGQLSSTGAIQGQLIVQILDSDLEGGSTGQGEMVRYNFNGPGTFQGITNGGSVGWGFGLFGCIPICGCDDPYASNYIPWVELGVDTCEYDCTDEDEDEICDEVDDCVGEYDSCGVCNGPGAVLACGCTDVPEGDCDCEGSQLDVLGVCGGGCLSDQNGNGVCDDIEVFGCTYELGQNYSLEATIDDGSCIFPCEGEVNINVFDWDGDYAVTVTDFLMMLSVYGDVDVDLDGIWDSGDLCVDTDACNYATDPSEPCSSLDVLGICGGGCEADEDDDGICDDVDTCVGIEDECGVCNGPGPTEIVIEDITVLYDSVYLPQLGEWYVYDFGADTTFSYTCAPSFSVCGDPVSYQGYDYATVLIGEQCWFSENLRYLPSVGIPSENPGVPNATVCDYYGNNIDEAMNQWNYQTYGALYNFPAVTNWQLCPSGYHVPSDDDWKVLESYLGMPAYEIESTADSRGNSVGAHLSLKADSPLWGNQGNNSTQFSGIPSGTSFSSNDLCALIASEPNDGGWAIFGSSTLAEAEGVWVRLLTDNITDGIPRFGVDTYQLNGTDIYFSVRCVKDE